MSFAFDGTEIVYSNLGGAGPLEPLGWSAGQQGIRYVNVGTVYTLAGALNLDLVLTNLTSYQPYDPSLNALSGQFAAINLACNTAVNLRVTIKLSCSSGSSCKLCDALSGAAITSCYTSGCACFGATVTSQSDCAGARKEKHRAAYGCPYLEAPVVLPGDAMTTMTVFDLDTGPLGDYIEALTVPEYAYYKTPLRPASDTVVPSRLLPLAVRRQVHSI